MGGGDIPRSGLNDELRSPLSLLMSLKVIPGAAYEEIDVARNRAGHGGDVEMERTTAEAVQRTTDNATVSWATMLGATMSKWAEHERDADDVMRWLSGIDDGSG
ncbi:hypothetical protein M0R45_019869 [Rubus argutus]|uniref:Uncharacterized protein n=1 Tax=Rubus argutus TaxID=59490 RepID=A0AAW1X8C2_RUBAR